MKSTQILLIGFSLLACAIVWVSYRGRQARRAEPTAQADSQLDASWDYKVGLPVIPPDHDAQLTFQIQPQGTESERSQEWIATYSDAGHVARFRLQIDAIDRTETHGIKMGFGKGRLIAMAGSDDATMLPALAFALGGTLPSDIQKQPVLEFDYVHFGDRMSTIPGGGFQFKPAGDWTAMKLFFDGMTEDDHATVYFSLNTVAGEARFSMSNSEYGDPVLRHLATVL